MGSFLLWRRNANGMGPRPRASRGRLRLLVGSVSDEGGAASCRTGSDILLKLCGFVPRRPQCAFSAASSVALGPATSAILSHPVRTPARRNDAESVVYHPAGRVVGHIPQAFTAENTFRTSRPLSVFPLFLTARRDLRLPTKGSLYRRIEKSSRSALESSRTWE